MNERRVSDCWLKDGDTIRGGQTRISVRVKSSETAALVVGNDPQDLAATFIPAKLEEVVGSYRVQEKIGSGSMVAVHFSHSRILRRFVDVSGIGMLNCRFNFRRGASFFP